MSKNVSLFVCYSQGILFYFRVVAVEVTIFGIQTTNIVLDLNRKDVIRFMFFD